MTEMKLSDTIELRNKKDDHMLIDSETKVPYERKVTFQDFDKKPTIKVVITCLPNMLPVASALRYVKLAFVDPQKKITDYHPKEGEIHFAGLHEKFTEDTKVGTFSVKKDPEGNPP